MSKTIRQPRAHKTSLFSRDPTRRAHFIHSPTLGSASLRFELFQRWVLVDGHQVLDASSTVLACLMAFDGVASDDDVRSAYCACADALRHADAIRIAWLDGARINARNLSSMTTLALHRVNKWLCFEDAKSELLRCLADTPIGKDSTPLGNSLWIRLREDCMAWLQTILPPVLFGHVSGAASLSALPRSALARNERKLALNVEANELMEDTSSIHKPYARAFEAALLGRTSSSGTQFIKKLTDALRPPVRGSASSRRAAILQALQVLATEVEYADEASCLLYLFALELVEHGTRRKKILAPTTPYDYVQSLAMDFHSAASGLRLWGIAPEPYANIFDKLLNTSATIASYRVAGLKAFHLFLRSWWKVPNLPVAMFSVEIDTAVAANLVWPHELKSVLRWLNEAENSRFNRSLATAFAIAGNAMVRIGELMVLQMRNIIDEGHAIIIEIARDIRDGKEKSAEGRRRLTITDVDAMNEIREWVKRRKKEEARGDDYKQALDEDYVFSNPSSYQERKRPPSTVIAPA